MDRRTFLKGSAATVSGLVLGFHLPASAEAAPAPAPAAALINSWLRISTDNRVTIYLLKSEMGQNVFTTLPSLVAEELGADWRLVQVEHAPPLPPYGQFGEASVGSGSVRKGYLGLRTVGAAAREMLVAAAATAWGVAPSACVAEHGFVVEKGGSRKVPFGSVANAAARLPVPESPRLKSPADFELLGKPLPRLDSPSKVEGTAVFGIDVVVPDMLVGAARVSPAPGGEVANFDALQVPEGVQLVRVPHGVVAMARRYWTAQQALNQLDIRFEGSPHEHVGTREISKALHSAADWSRAPVAHTEGRPAEHFVAGARRVTASYEVPYLAHATMEPMNCTAHVRGSRCELWIPTQAPFANKTAVAHLLGIPPENVDVHVTLLGCGFGRRSEQDFVFQAVLASKAVGRPVKVIWSREEDIRHDFYRPAFVGTLEAVLDGAGAPVALRSVSAGSSIVAGHMPDALAKSGGIDFTAMQGWAEFPYAIPHREVRTAITPTVLPVGFWRSVGETQNVFFMESFIDELAHSAGADPANYRRKLLVGRPRILAVLERALTESGWGKPLPAGRARGVALAHAVETPTAQVAEVSVEGGKLTVHRVTCAYDCGPVLNPQTAEAQLEGGIAFGLSAALRGEITVHQGRVQQQNFHDYRVLRLRDMPRVDIHRAPSDAKIGGMGEAGVPAIAPAVANAIFAATGRRLRTLPLEKALAEPG